MKKQKGITLIALILTIIVILILVAIVINFAVNDNGIITKAKMASERTKVETDRESLQDYIFGRNVYDIVTGEVDLGNLRTKLGNAGWEIISNEGKLKVIGKQSGETFTITQSGTIKVEQEGGISGGETVSGMKSYDQASKDANGYLTENAKYTSGSDVAVIPRGFKISQEEGEQTISGGLVIQDEAENEFVWIPVANPVLDLSDEEGIDNKDKNTNINMAETIAGINKNEVIDLIEENMLETGPKYMAAKLADGHYYGILYDFDENGDCEFRGVDNFTVYFTGSEEYDPVVQSVCDYKGFYVGRYTTGFNLEAVVSKAGERVDIDKTSWDNMYNKQKYFKSDSVQSSMIYGFEYDQVMIFVNKKSDEDGKAFNVGNSGKKSHMNYKDYPFETGKEGDMVQNIYGLLFGVSCCTREDDGKRLGKLRGGLNRLNTRSSEGEFYAPSNIINNDIYLGYGIGSRLSLYIK